jgi:methionyl aminopeptidase
MLVEGMTFTIEPMINVGTHQLATTWDDDWTVTTRDGQRSAQFEHTILVTETGHEVLTLPGEGRPAEANVLDMGEPLPDPTSRG